MRYVHDHPRSWPELVLHLAPSDAEVLRNFAARCGVDVESADPSVIEDVYHEWCQSGCVEVNHD